MTLKEFTDTEIYHATCCMITHEIASGEYWILMDEDDQQRTLSQGLDSVHYLIETKTIIIKWFFEFDKNEPDDGKALKLKWTMPDSDWDRVKRVKFKDHE